jgi:hypothetical protein
METICEQAKPVGQSATSAKGEDSWTYVYLAIGLALTIEGTILQMSEPLRFPDNLIVYVVLGVPTFVLFIFHEWTQNLLSRMAFGRLGQSAETGRRKAHRRGPRDSV